MKSKPKLQITMALAVVFSAWFGGCATDKLAADEITDEQILESGMTINRLRHQIWGDKLWPENQR